MSTPHPSPRDYLTDAHAAGFPCALLLPICPPYAEPKYVDAKNLGKAPAVYRLTEDGSWRWRNLGQWQHGVGGDDYSRSAAAGANVGLVLGRESAVGQFVFVDIDPVVGAPGDQKTAVATAFSTEVVAGLRKHFGVPLWTRRSRVGRAGVLLRLPAGAAPGSKVVYAFEHPVVGAFAKIEVLTAGQQVVIGGVHASGVDISWVLDSEAPTAFPSPSTVAEVPDFEAVVTGVDAVAKALEAYGIVPRRGRVREASAHEGGADAAPGVDALVGLLEALPNTAAVDRDAYVRVMLAVSGCVQAMAPAPRPEDVDKIRTAACNWACRWQRQDGAASDYTSEAAKWDNDFSLQRGISVGWSYLLAFAARVGAKGAAAAAEFADTELLPATTPVPAQAMQSEVLADAPREIWLNSDLAVTAREIAWAMAEAGAIYKFGDRLSYVETAGDRVSVHALTSDSIPHVSAAVCQVMMRTKAGNAVAVTMPKDVRNLVVSAPADRCGVPALNGIAAAPILTGDGGIRSASGFDAATGLWALPVPSLDVPDAPSRGDAEAALTTLRQALRTFPFADADNVHDPALGVPVVDLSKPPGAAESAALISLLTAICRPSLPLAPGFMVTAPIGSGSGVGKGLLVRVIAAIAYGYEPRAFNAGRTAEEMDKRLGAELICADPILLLDNVNSTALRSDTLASVLTESPTRIRLLGESTMIQLSAKTFIAVTGNGLTVSEDLVRRFIVCALDARVENPSARPFRDGQAEFLSATSRRRGELLSAALVIWRWGRQHADTVRGEPLGSFETWSRWCRDPLVALGCRDPVSQIAEARALDPYRLQLEAAFSEWWQVHGDESVRAADVADSVCRLLNPQGFTRQSHAAAIGRHRGSRCGDWSLEYSEGSKTRKGGGSYKLCWVGDGTPPPRQQRGAEFPLLTVLTGGRA